MDKVKNIVVLLLVVVVCFVTDSDCGRRGGGGFSRGGFSSSSSRSRSNYGSRGNYGGNFGGFNFGSSNYRGGYSYRYGFTYWSGGSYPKTTGHTTRTFKKSSNKFGASNYGFHGMGEAPKYFTAGAAPNGLFQAGGSRNGFDLTKGPGFLGGADPSLGIMEVHHRYLVYTSIKVRKTSNGNGKVETKQKKKQDPPDAPDAPGSGGGGGDDDDDDESPELDLDLNLDLDLELDLDLNCDPECPSGAFCDAGVCRCRNGYDAIFGKCYNTEPWNRFAVKTVDKKSPGDRCNSTSTCGDINMVCEESEIDEFDDDDILGLAFDTFSEFDDNSTESSVCVCRNGTKWNSETKECQVYLDVDCSNVDLEAIENDINSNGTTNFNFTSSNATFSPVIYDTDNLTAITPEKTLINSNLLEIVDPDRVTTKELTGIFCREIAQLSKYYDDKHKEALRDLPKPIPRTTRKPYVYQPRENESGLSIGAVLGLALGIPFLFIAKACCCIFCSEEEDDD